MLRQEGNQKLKDGQYHEAVEKYTRAVDFYQESGSTEWEAKTYCNISLAYLLLKKPESALQFSLKAIELDQKSGKVRILQQNNNILCLSPNFSGLLPCSSFKLLSQ